MIPLDAAHGVGLLNFLPVNSPPQPSGEGLVSFLARHFQYTVSISKYFQSASQRSAGPRTCSFVPKRGLIQRTFPSSPLVVVCRGASSSSGLRGFQSTQRARHERIAGQPPSSSLMPAFALSGNSGHREGRSACTENVYMEHRNGGEGLQDGRV